MRRSASLSSVGVVLALLVLTCVPVEAARRGRVTGVVLDQAGTPLPGASVAVFVADSELAKPVRNTVTDGTGRFTLLVAPGSYVLRAVATGFSAAEARALVASNRETVLDTIALRRSGTLAERRRGQGDAYRRVVRSARGHVFNVDELPEEAREQANAEALANDEAPNATHGILQFVGTAGERGYAATNFALTRRALGSDLALTAQLGTEHAPRRLEAVARKEIGKDHEIAVAFGFGAFDVPGEAGRDRLDQYSLQVTDRWQVAGPLVVVYGFNYSKYSGVSDDGALLPRLGFEMSPTHRTQIFGGFAPGSSLREVASFDLETGRIAFVEPDTPIVAGGRPRADRSRRLELGVGHLIDEQSNFEVMAFYDTASGKPIGLLALPPSGASAEYTTGELNGRTAGVRVLYTRQLNSILSGTIGYATGRGATLTATALADPASAVQTATFNVVAARIEAAFDTGTRISAVYRLAPGHVVFAIDPFAGRLTAFEPAAGLFVAQQLPSFGFLPGEWEATLDVRNLFDAKTAVDDTDLLLADYRRLVRAGLSLRF